MGTGSVGDRIDDLMMAEKWQQARALIEKQLAVEPDSHWLHTQLGATHYGQRRYKKALAVLLKSFDLVPDCPLTLWHLAGTLDALNDHASALKIYTWLLESKRSAADDPCWESDAWTEALKTDSVFRIGLCYAQLKKKNKARACLRRYVDLLLSGATGSYPVEEALQQVRDLGPAAGTAVGAELRKAAAWLTRSSGAEAVANGLPKLNRKKLLALQQA